MSDNGWQPIETAPKDGTRILCAVKLEDGYEVITLRWRESRNQWSEGSSGWGDARYDPEFVTHWQPLPEPPHA